MNGEVIVAGGGVGFFGMLLIGFLAGWIAEKTMNRDHGFLTNILVGIAGSFVGGTAASILGFSWYGFVGNLVVATLGAIAILWFFGNRERATRMRQPMAGGPATGDGSNAPHDDLRKDDAVKSKTSAPIYHSKDDS